MDFQNSVAESPTNSNVYLPQTTEEVKKVQLIANAKEIIKKVYANPEALREVLSCIASKRRPDESIFLKDLLKWEESDVYKTYNVKHKGTFAREFEKYAPKYATASVTGDSTNQEDYYSYANSNITIYFPYSENFSFDSLTQERISLAAAAADTDEGPGEEPTVISDTVVYNPKIINDTYAEVHPTHIIGVVNEQRVLAACDDPNDPDCNPGPGTPLAKRIYIGWTVINNKHQYDHLISFTGNGGGSEIMVCHLTGYLKPVDGHVVTFEDVNAVYFSRRDIRKGYGHEVNMIWDDDWEVDDREQVLAVYEEDNTSEITFTGSLGTTLIDSSILSGPNTVQGSIGFTVKRKSQDAIIKQLKISRSSYFTFAKADQGWGFQEQYSFGFKWPLIDWRGPNFGYTMPYQQL